MSVEITNLIWKASIKPAGKKLVLLWFGDKCKHDGSDVFGYIQTIASAADLSPSMAQRYVSQLLAEGFISVTSHRRGGAPGTVTHCRVNVDRLKALPPKARSARRSASFVETKTVADEVVHTGSSDAASLIENADSSRVQRHALMRETAFTYAAHNVPNRPYNVCATQDVLQKAIKLREDLKQAGIHRIPQAKLIALSQESVAVEEVLKAIHESAGKDDAVSYGIAIVLKRRSGSSELKNKPAWDSTRSTIEEEGERLGLGKWDQAAWPHGGGPSFAGYTERVRQARKQELLAATQS